MIITKDSEAGAGTLTDVLTIALTYYVEEHGATDLPETLTDPNLMTTVLRPPRQSTRNDLTIKRPVCRIIANDQSRSSRILKQGRPIVIYDTAENTLHTFDVIGMPGYYHILKSDHGKFIPAYRDIDGVHEENGSFVLTIRTT